MSDAAKPAEVPAAAPVATPAAPAEAAAPAAAAAPVAKPDLVGAGKSALADVQSGDYKGAATALGGAFTEVSKTEEGKKAIADITEDVKKGDYAGAAQAAFGLFK